MLAVPLVEGANRWLKASAGLRQRVEMTALRCARRSHDQAEALQLGEPDSQDFGGDVLRCVGELAEGALSVDDEIAHKKH